MMMISPRSSFIVVLCLIFVPQITSAFLRKSTQHKRFGQLPGTQENTIVLKNKLFFKGEPLEPETLAPRYGSIVLDCEVGGTPSPTIHWLKNGVRITQGSSRSIRDDEAYYENHNAMNLQLSTTHSKLYLDCLSESDEAKYTCVAENAMIRKSQTTFLRVENPDNILYSEVHKCVGKRSKRGEPARIYMWTVGRLEYENSKVQLFCRAEGTPAPTIVWYDRNNKPIEDDENYTTAANGDLIIHKITWMENMGAYTCVADNRFGTDTKESFLYPTPREDDFGFPL